MSRRYSISRLVLSSFWAVAEATALLIRARSSTTLATVWSNTCPLHSLKRKKFKGLSISPSPSVCKSLIQTLSHCKSPVWGGHCIIESVPSAGYTEKFIGLSQLLASIKDLLAPFSFRYHLSLETVPATAWWTVFKVLTRQIPDGNVFALE